MENPSQLKNPEHGSMMAAVLASNLKQSSFADVKIVCPDGSAWAHRLVLAAVSPVLKSLLLSVANDDVATLYLPQLSVLHLNLVLDYVYKGRMFMRASQLQHVLGVIEVLSLECGVSVSKKVPKEEAEETSGWVEEAVFTSFTDKGLNEVCRNLKIKEEVESLAPSWFDDDSEAVEVTPNIDHDPNRSQRQSTSAEDGFAVEELGVDSDTEEDDHEAQSPEEGDQAEDDGDENKPKISKHKCFMCGKSFQHEDNLRIHVQSHLGVRAQLRSCQVCKKNFRTSLEHELHMKSHSYHRFLKRHRLGFAPKPKSLGAIAAQHLIKKSIKRLLPKVKPLEQVSEVKESESISDKKNKNESKAKRKSNNKTKLNPTKSVKVRRQPNGDFRPKGHEEDLAWEACKLKIKIPVVKCDSKPKQQQLIPVPKPKMSTKLKINLSNLQGGAGPSGLQTTLKKGKKRKAESVSDLPKAKAAKKSRKLSLASASSASPASSPRSPKKKAVKMTLEESLTCPTCDKVFMARSVFDRHLKKSKHGIFEGDKDIMSPPPVISEALDKAAAEGRQLPHYNEVIQPTIQVGGREVNKYECHLCNQVFLRVKDLAKHRERMMCSAWLNK